MPESRAWGFHLRKGVEMRRFQNLTELFRGKVSQNMQVDILPHPISQIVISPA